MKQKLHNESGSISIDALLGITMFTIAILAIMMISMLARVQSTMQYALSQTAKEVSGYFYMLDKTGVTKLISGTDTEAAKEKVKDIDDTIGYVLEFSTNTNNLKDEAFKIAEDAQNGNISLEEIKNVGNNVEEAKKTADKLLSSVDKITDDPVKQIKNILSVFAKSMANRAVGKYVAPWVCETIMPRYLGGNRNSTDEMLKSMGIEKGLDGIDFSNSELLSDGRSIKLVAVYRLNPKAITLGMINLPDNQGILIRQTACTAAWLVPDDSNTASLKSIGG